jgi:NADPH:quinone reductase-like Zn-dependent oxidoreductase
LHHGKELANNAWSVWHVLISAARNWFRPDSSPKVVLASVASNGPQLQSIMNWVAERKIQPVIDRVFLLDDAAAALEYLEQGRATGKVVIAVGNLDLDASR